MRNGATKSDDAATFGGFDVIIAGLADCGLRIAAFFAAGMAPKRPAIRNSLASGNWQVMVPVPSLTVRLATNLTGNRATGMGMGTVETETSDSRERKTGPKPAFWAISGPPEVASRESLDA
jgi:hypothetical protein